MLFVPFAGAALAYAAEAFADNFSENGVRHLGDGKSGGRVMKNDSRLKFSICFDTARLSRGAFRANIGGRVRRMMNFRRDLSGLFTRRGRNPERKRLHVTRDHLNLKQSTGLSLSPAKLAGELN